MFCKYIENTSLYVNFVLKLHMDKVIIDSRLAIIFLLVPVIIVILVSQKKLELFSPNQFVMTKCSCSLNIVLTYHYTSVCCSISCQSKALFYQLISLQMEKIRWVLGL